MTFFDTILGLADLIWPPRCLSCGTRVEAFRPETPETAFCPVCAVSLMQVVSPCCPRCALPFEGAGPDHLCGECLSDPPAFDAARALYQYGEAAAKAVTRLKYVPVPHLGGILGKMLLCEARYIGTVDMVVPVPLHRERLIDRGFNQSALLSRPIARGLGVPVMGDVVTRTRGTVSQAGLSRDARRTNLRGAFAVTAPDRIAAKRVLLVDDVVTTGATVREVAACLMRAGARRVSVAAFARAC